MIEVAIDFKRVNYSLGAHRQNLYVDCSISILSYVSMAAAKWLRGHARIGCTPAQLPRHPQSLHTGALLNAAKRSDAR